MKRFSALLFVLFTLQSPVFAQAPVTDSASVSHVRRWLHAVEFGPLFQAGIRQALKDGGTTTPILESILNAKADQIEAIVAPVFAGHLSFAEAKAAADFYESETGRSVVAQGKMQLFDKSIPMSLTPEQEFQATRFMETSAGKKSNSLANDAVISQEYFAALRKALAK